MRSYYSLQPAHKRLKYPVIFVAVAALLVAGFFFLKRGGHPVQNLIHSPKLTFDNSLSQTEQKQIQNAVSAQHLTLSSDVAASARTDTEKPANQPVLDVYVPVTSFTAVRQNVNKADFAQIATYIPSDTDVVIKNSLAHTLGIQPDKLQPLTGSSATIDESAVVLLPLDQLTSSVKLLRLDNHYYLDDFNHGALFRTLSFTGGDTTTLSQLSLVTLPEKGSVLKINMTGVTALTRQMITKLQEVGSASYFSEKIGNFLSDADITHISNEVSFKPDCAYAKSSFCAPPAMLDALKASGVDLVELDGNHGNDQGNQYNTDTINLYHSLGWHTFGGGVNSTEAAKPYNLDLKNTRIAFLGYNDADALGSGVIATPDHAGGNHFDLVQATKDIAAAKAEGNFVIVDIQFLECYSYPDGYTEFPQCDGPIPNQRETFHSVIDAGADMVIGSQAHHPQTYELYNSKPIYYGLGNLYFDQTQWPGTERSYVLTHYFMAGKLIQTKLTTTVFDQALQTRLATETEASYLLQRLHDAR